MLNTTKTNGRWGRVTRWHLLMAAAEVGLIAALAIWFPSGDLNAGIQGSKHDFSALSEDEQVCIFCHGAHDNNASEEDAPLWNHAVTAKQFRLYNSPSMDAAPTQPSGPSKLCLSCHDGTIAIDSFGSHQGSARMKPSAMVGAGPADLSNDHPIGFVYDDALAARDGELHFPESSPSGLGGTIAEDLLFDDQMECSSCHDAHNGPAATAVNSKLLVVTPSRSQLCLTCHDK